MLADLECVSDDGVIVLAVEVKDRVLTISQLRNKVPDIRERQVSEIFFVAQQGVAETDISEVESLINHEFAGGHNIYVMNLVKLASVALALLGESGRRDFLIEVGVQLEQYRSEIQHRQAWAELLRAV